MKISIFLINIKVLSIYTIFVLLFISCASESQDHPVDLDSEGGSSQFFEGQKEETYVEDTSSFDPQPQNFQIDTACPGALQSKLQIGNIAEITIYQLKARVAPGFDTATEHVLAEDRVVEIINGPVCVDSGWWWYIHFSGTISTGDYLDFYAWMVEVDYDTYYLRKTN